MCQCLLHSHHQLHHDHQLLNKLQKSLQAFRLYCQHFCLVQCCLQVPAHTCSARFVDIHDQVCFCCCDRSCTGGKTEDFIAAAKLMHQAGGKVKVPTYLVPATQKVWMDVYGMPVPGCDGKTAAQIFQAAGCDTPASPSCAACLGGPKDTYARMNKPEVCVSTTNR